MNPFKLTQEEIDTRMALYPLKKLNLELKTFPQRKHQAKMA